MKLPKNLNIRDQELKAVIQTLYSRVEPILNKPMHIHFTDHSIKHSERILAIVNGLIEKASPPLNDDEKFILVSAILLHDIGMQTPKYLDLESHLLEKNDLERIRELHHELSERFILDSVDSQSSSGYDLGLNSKLEYVEDIAKVAKYHRKLDIELLDDHPIGSNNIRLKLLAALIRLGDCLDIDHRRVRIDELNIFPLPDESKYFWFVHQYVQGVVLDSLEIKIFFSFPETYKTDQAIAKTISDDLKCEVEKQVDEVYPYLDRYNMRIHKNIAVEIRYSSIVQEMPGELLEYIKEDNINFIKKFSLEEFDKTKSAFNTLYYYVDDTKEASIFDNLCQILFLHLIGKQKLYSQFYEELKKEILKFHKSTLHIFFEHRIDAIKAFFEGQLSSCLEYLEKAYEETKKSDVPNWLIMDVLIDCRNISNKIDQSKNQIQFKNKWQDLLNENDEPLYYPLIDRLSENHSQKINEFLVQQKIDDPYTVRLGGLESLYTNAMRAYIIAVRHASLIQIICTYDKMIDSLTAFCSVYREHTAFLNLIKLLIMKQDGKRLEKTITAFSYLQNISSVNENDLKEMLSAIELIPEKHRRFMSKLLLIRYFGYYFSDEDYAISSSDIIYEINNWLIEPNHIVPLFDYIYMTLIENSKRLDNDFIISFIITILRSKWNKYFKGIFEVIRNLDFDLVSEERMNCLIVEILKIMEDNGAQNIIDPYSLYVALIILREKTISLATDIDKAVVNYFPDIYCHEYSLSFNLGNYTDDPMTRIKPYIDKIRNRNITQGTNGVTFGYGTDPYLTIRNIIECDNLTLKNNEIQLIIDAAKETLLAEKQTLESKIDATKLLIYLINRFDPSNAYILWSELGDKLDTVLKGYDDLLSKTTKNTLRIFLSLLELCITKNSSFSFLTILASSVQAESYQVVKSLEAIYTFLYNANFKSFDRTVLMTLFQHIISARGHNVEKARYVIYSLASLANSEIGELALQQLLKKMDEESGSLKYVILKRVGQLTIADSEYISCIIQKGKEDNNYCVRKKANSILCERGL